MTLRLRLLLTVAGIVAAAVVVGVYAARYATARQLRAGVDEFLVDRSARIGRFGGLALDRRPEFAGLGTAPGGLGSFVGFDAVVQFVGADGAVHPLVAQQATLPVDDGDRALAASGDQARLRDVTVDGVHHRMITAPLPGGGAVEVARSVAELDDVLASLRNQLLGVAVAGTALAALVAWAVARRTVKPIEQLTAASERVAATQDLGTPIPVERHDEVGRLGAAFNVMLAALDTSRRQQRQLVVDASHELRTPITAVRTNLEFLARAGGLDEETRRKLLAEAGLELDELTNLVSELVELATEERAEEPPEPVDLADLVAQVAERYRRRSGRTVTMQIESTGVVQGRPLMLDRAVANLIDNALKFSPPSTPVEVVVAGGRIEVRDRGQGVAEADRPLVFDRFFRAAAARGRPGSGLGLAIVRRVADLHGGRATFEERTGGGSIARLDLPGRPAGDGSRSADPGPGVGPRRAGLDEA